MVRTPKKEPRFIAAVEYAAVAALLVVAAALARSDFSTAIRAVVFCSALAVCFGVCAFNSFVYRRLCMGRVRLDGRS